MISALRLSVMMLALAMLALVVLAALPSGRAYAQAADLQELIAALAEGNFSDREKAVAALAATGDMAVVPTLNALTAGDLYVRESDGKVVITAKAPSRSYRLTDPLSGEDLGVVKRREVSKIKVNNGLRRAIRTALSGLTLMSPNRTVRLAAADGIFKAASPDAIEALDAAIAAEKDAEVKALMEQARAASVLSSDLSADEKTRALDTLAERG
ncbi:MAG TPA: urea ABC transporter permease subunit UrtB, partial [Afifellaceae bacterium]|nr:urea ABC transporter permease subunit UrtB [Afifellaceae bacterium]